MADSPGVDGADAVKAALDAIGAGADLELRLLARTVAGRVQQNAGNRRRQSQSPQATGHTGSSIVVREDPRPGGQAAFLVYVDVPPDLPENLPLWLEFGTVKMGGRPFLFPAARDEEPDFRAQAEQVLARIVDAAARGGAR